MLATLPVARIKMCRGRSGYNSRFNTSSPFDPNPFGNSSLISLNVISLALACRPMSVRTYGCSSATTNKTTFELS
jgi:hypothetical protein